METLVRYIEVYQQLSNGQALADNVIFGYRLLRLFGVILFCLNKQIASSLTRSRSDAKQLAEYFGEHQIVPIREGALDAEHHQVVLTMIAQECLYNSDLFEPSDEHHDSEWQHLIEAYFRVADFPPRKGARTKIVVEAVQTLNLM
ncbi:hypothetical protein A141_22170 [Vibrio crassostreae ZF-91]|nr:hypothetical protein A141_22170 [Vibrio crassostreae ZF-91]